MLKAMRIHHTEQTPVILLGQGRSGTSITAQLMREHLGVAFGTESQFIPRYYRRLRRYGDLRSDENLHRLVSHLLQERWFQRSRKFDDFQTSVEAVVADVQQRTFRGVLDAVFGQLAKHLEMARYGDKTPDYSRHLDIFADVYPDAKYIHVVRDGRDVALSMFSMYVMPKHVYFAAKDWKDHINWVDTFLKRLPAEQRIEIRYEALLDEPVRTFSALARFLKIEDPDGELAASLQRTLPDRIKKGNYGKWRTGLSLDEVKQFEQVACTELAQHGYETTLERPGPLPSIGRRALWRLQGKLDLWSRPRYWREHWHRVGLRARDAWRSMGFPPRRGVDPIR